MLIMCKKYLLGATEDREIVFGEFEVTQRNGYSEFTASFDTVRPFKGSDYDLEEYFEGWMDGLDKAYLYDLCEQHWCSPQDLPSKLADECYDVRDALDCSLYPEEMKIDDEYWYFESSIWGQHDTREDGMDEYTDKEAYDLLHELWDAHHLKKVDSEVVEKVQKLTQMLEEVDEEEWIEDYIRRNF
jgi:hypothetical protein